MEESIRICRDCGLKAYTEADLTNFVKRKTGRYGRDNWCKICAREYRRKRDGYKIKNYLRKCRKCGIEAVARKDLELFSKNKNYSYGRINLCKKCNNLLAKQRRIQNPLFVRYQSMITRCYKKNASTYINYGARGITVCDEWLKDRQAFIRWANENGFRPELEIDRIDNEGNYSPENCRWVTHQKQMRNTRVNVTNLIKKTRICFKCKIEKSFSEFYKDKNDVVCGISYRCISCEKEYKRNKKRN